MAGARWRAGKEASRPGVGRAGGGAAGSPARDPAPRMDQTAGPPTGGLLHRRQRRGQRVGARGASPPGARTRGGRSGPGADRHLRRGGGRLARAPSYRRRLQALDADRLFGNAPPARRGAPQARPGGEGAHHVGLRRTHRSLDDDARGVALADTARLRTGTLITSGQCSPGGDACGVRVRLPGGHVRASGEPGGRDREAARARPGRDRDVHAV